MMMKMRTLFTLARNFRREHGLIDLDFTGA